MKSNSDESGRKWLEGKIIEVERDIEQWNLKEQHHLKEINKKETALETFEISRNERQGVLLV